MGDISSMAGVDALAQELQSRVDSLSVLVNNAGYLGNEYRISDDGLEMHFAVNVLSPWRLTHALLPVLRAADGARVLHVTGGDRPGPVDVDNLQAEKGFKGLMTYTHSKSILESMSMALAEELKSEGITVNVVFPGRASTAMTRSLTAKGLPGPMKIMMPFFRLFFREDGGKSAAKASMSTVWGVTADELDGVTGRYFDTHTNQQPLHPTAYEPETQRRIMELMTSAV